MGVFGGDIFVLLFFVWRFLMRKVNLACFGFLEDDMAVKLHENRVFVVLYM